MEVIKRCAVPRYEVECYECHSVIRYMKYEVDSNYYITCPVCGELVSCSTSFPINKEELGKNLGTTPEIKIECKHEYEMCTNSITSTGQQYICKKCGHMKTIPFKNEYGYTVTCVNTGTDIPFAKNDDVDKGAV